MSSKHRKSGSRKHVGYSITKRNGAIVLPPNVREFSIGQRVYFHVDGTSISFSGKPKKSRNGRLLSSRVRRAVRSLTAYGPRSVAADV